ncbi:MAG: hypothetical protein KA099_01405 [Alphaproteobacteria bacterium]|nr:hypothetical protein [Alphaproteobacteria bacterium]MBP7758679.1 hypothetical protein [Alphaproteobacteria bacterium]MBP7761707.1 hypothetical protein [Alphaproteobacteria bacterium]MBP7903958.1 hypothetical protein [Alphaproteobacteria bacterium]
MSIFFKGQPDLPPIAIIDIGSNSVRMVIFRSADPVLIEKEQCFLGRDLLKTGLLPPKACKKVRKTIKKFIEITKEHNIKTIIAIGTAAVRTATDGPDFVKSLEKEFGLSISIIPGDEEARLSALGVISRAPSAQGIVADLGGGSIELAHVKDGKVGKALSLPLGSLILADYGKDLRKVLKESFSGLSPDFRKKEPLYVVGGTLRAIAKISIKMSKQKYELHGYRMSRKQIAEVCEHIRDLTPSALVKKYKVQSSRAKTLKPSTILLEELVAELEIPEIIVSLGGLRDGVLREYFERKSKAN